MTAIPRDPAFDSTLNIVREGFEFIWNRCRRFDSDLFFTRVMGKPTVCIHGAEAAKLFYDESKFARHGALPRRVVTSLFGKKAVHTLDDAPHRQRKSAFLGLMSQENLGRLMDETANAWRRAIRRWESSSEVVLLDAAQCVLADAVCTWAGLPLKPSEIEKRARDLASMVDGFGGVGPRLWKAKLARIRTEMWVGGILQRVRQGKLQVSPDCALHVMAFHRDSDGRMLDLRTAAVELINVLRPTVAVGWYIAFAATALHQHPEARERIARESTSDGGLPFADAFMQEVRRYYPFTPFLGAKVRTPFVWRDFDFKPGMLVLLDVYGTEHDPKLWSAPEEFRPERFMNWSSDPYEFIPQGGGDHAHGHRCPGEWITMHNITLALHFLTRCVTYEVPPGQDLSIDLTRMPTQPASGFVMRGMRATNELDRPAPRLPSVSASRSRETTAGSAPEHVAASPAAE
jgi:fatty-acid peroxygenase